MRSWQGIFPSTAVVAFASNFAGLANHERDPGSPYSWPMASANWIGDRRYIVTAVQHS